MHNIYSAHGKKSLSWNNYQILCKEKKKKKKCLDDFDTEWRITIGLRERGVRLLCNMIENKKEETTSIKH